MNVDMLELLPYEKEALLEALRRDLSSQRNLALLDSGYKFWHQRNVQLNLRLLEVLNPKGHIFSKPDCNHFPTKHSSSYDVRKKTPNVYELVLRKVYFKRF
jgi:hypothetical protein